MVKRFDQKRENEYFQDLTSLRKQGAMDKYVSKFQKIRVMIHHILEEQLKFLFIKGLMDPLQGMVKVSSSRNLDDVIRAAYDRELIVKSLKGGKKYKGPITRKPFTNKEGTSKAKPFPLPRMSQLDITTWR